MEIRRRRSLTGRVLLAVLFLVILAVVFAATVLVVWTTRSNSALINPALSIERIELPPDVQADQYAAVVWDEAILLAAATTGRRAESDLIELWRTGDGRGWENNGQIEMDDLIIDRPVLAVIGDRLVLYPETARPRAFDCPALFSFDGTTWSQAPLAGSGPPISTPVEGPADRWYAPGVRSQAVLLISSDDGLNWNRESVITNGAGDISAAIRIAADGRMLAVVSSAGDGGNGVVTQVGFSTPPYDRWTVESTQEGLRTPQLFSAEGEVYIAAPYLQTDRLSSIIGIGGRGRIGIYRMTESSFSLLSDLPSAGDASMPRVLLDEGIVTIFYRTHRTDRDYPPFFSALVPARPAAVQIASGNLFMAPGWDHTK
jgi:hypothetical protein